MFRQPPSKFINAAAAFLLWWNIQHLEGSDRYGRHLLEKKRIDNLQLLQIRRYPRMPLLVTSPCVKCCALNALLQPKVSEILSDHAFTSGKIPFLAGQCCSEIFRGTVLVLACWKLRTFSHSHFQPTLSQKHLSPSKLLENVCIQCIPSAHHSFCVTTYLWENGLLPAVCVLMARLPVSQPSQVYAQLPKIPPVLLVNWHQIFCLVT